MKIAYHSDLHLEAGGLPADFCSNRDFDVLILGGDVCTYRTLWCIGLIRERVGSEVPIIYIAGNHEYYRAPSFEEGHAAIRVECEKHNIRFVENEVVSFPDHNVDIICCTLWSDLTSFSQFSMEEKREVCTHIRDFHVIGGFTVDLMSEKHKASVEFLHRELSSRKNSDVTTVVATHFAPLESLQHRAFAVSPISAYFNCDLLAFFYEYTPKHWFYGHTHSGINAHCYNTLIHSNQRGYPRELGITYDQNFIVKV